MTHVKSTAAKACRSEAGTALVELAFLSTILALVLLGTIDFGHYFYDGILLGNAAQAGVQYGAHDIVTAYDFAGMQAAATSDVNGKIALSPSASTFCTCSDGTSAGTNISCNTTTCSAGSHRLQFVQVIATGTYSPLNSYPGIPATISLSRTAVMQVSQ